MSEKVHLIGSVSPTATSDEARRVQNLIILGIVVLFFIVLAISQLQRPGSASVDASSAVAVAVPAASDEEYSYYTERYWKAAEARAAESMAPVESATAAEPEYAYYTERYWKAADR